MTRFAIQCYPVVPVSVRELEPWIEEQLAALIEDDVGTARVLRLTQELPDDTIEVGWLFEFERPEPLEELLEDGPIAQALRDMRLLGMQPSILVRHAPGEEDAEESELALPGPVGVR
jgi:hypothetical protein